MYMSSLGTVHHWAAVSVVAGDISAAEIKPRMLHDGVA